MSPVVVSRIAILIIGALCTIESLVIKVFIVLFYLFALDCLFD